MPAIVCGSKRSYYSFDEMPSPPLYKKLRCSPSSSASASASASAIAAVYSSSSSCSALLHHLKALFPQSDPQKALEECGYNLDYTIKSLHERGLGAEKHYSGSAEEAVANVEQGMLNNDGNAAASEKILAPSNLPVDGTEWLDLFVREMMSATSVDDIRACASRVLEILEKSISARAAEESARSSQKENMMLKEKTEILIRENTILKKAVAIQHERQKEFEDKNRELQLLKQLVSQYQEQLRTLELNNYALTMHLRQAQQSKSIAGHFHPDVF